MAVNEQQFKNAMRLWATGVTVVTARSTQNDEVKGMTATSFSSVSLEPPQILVCINQSADTGDVMLDSQHFAVNILTDRQQEVSNQFAGGSSQQERFANVNWSEGDWGVPLLDDALASLECSIAQNILAGTHWVIVGTVEKIHCRAGGAPLLYYNSGYCSLGG